MIVYFDIETLPSNMDRIEAVLPAKPVVDDVKVGNRKDETAIEYRKLQYPILIEKWKGECEVINDKAQRKYRDTAKSVFKCQVFCVVFVVDDDEGDGFTIAEFKGDEETLIKEIDLWVKRNTRNPLEITWCGHYIREFDLPILRMRAMKYRCENLYNAIPTGRFADSIIDTMDEFMHPSRGSVKMSEACDFFGIECKTGMDGSQVYDFYLEGKGSEIVSYCLEDVLAARALHKKTLLG